MYSPPLRIELKPSYAIRGAVGVLAVLAVLALWLSNAPVWLLGIVPALLAISWPRSTHGWHELVLRGDGTAVALSQGGDETDVVPSRLQRRGVLTVLSLHEQHRLHTQLFTPTTLDTDARRRLTLWFERHASKHDEAPAHV